jgi:hypothetical protein
MMPPGHVTPELLLIRIPPLQQFDFVAETVSTPSMNVNGAQLTPSSSAPPQSSWAWPLGENKRRQQTSAFLARFMFDVKGKTINGD